LQIVNDASLFKEWKDEMRGMAGRIERVRGELRKWVAANQRVGLIGRGYRFLNLSFDVRTNAWLAAIPDGEPCLL
jgi:hypothetical protein